MVTSVSPYPTPIFTLGVPPGWSAGSTVHTAFYTQMLPTFLSLWTLIYFADLSIISTLA
jgi:hypothetical protein